MWARHLRKHRRIRWLLADGSGGRRRRQTCAGRPAAGAARQTPGDDQAGGHRRNVARWSVAVSERPAGGLAGRRDRSATVCGPAGAGSRSAGDGAVRRAGAAV